jgi:hypothetical protein
LEVEVEGVHELQQEEVVQQAQCDFLLLHVFLLGDPASLLCELLALG